MCTSVKRFAKYGPGKHPTALSTYLLLLLLLLKKMMAGVVEV